MDEGRAAEDAKIHETRRRRHPQRPKRDPLPRGRMDEGRAAEDAKINETRRRRHPQRPKRDPLPRGRMDEGRAAEDAKVMASGIDTAFLRSSDLFENQPDEVLKAVLLQGRLEEYGPGQVVFEQGDQG